MLCWTCFFLIANAIMDWRLHLLINIWEALPLINLWGEYSKTFMGPWIILIRPSMLDVMLDMLCLIANAIIDWHFQLLTSTPPGRTISMEVFGGIIISLHLAVMDIFINLPLRVLGEVNNT